MFRQRKDELLVKRPGDINGIDFMIKDLENCTVVLLDYTAQIQMDRCKNCKFYIGPIKSSIFVRNCDGCEITVCCSQFRCRDLTNSTVYLYTPNDPIVESSTNLTFAPYNLKYPQLEEHSNTSQIVGTFTDDDGVLQTKVNKWNLIFDFTKKEEGLNFALMDPANFQLMTGGQLVADIPDSNDADFIFELPTEFGGSLDSS